MAVCSFAIWKEISGPSGKNLGGPFKIVHHTTEGSTAEGALQAFAEHRSDPHFTVDQNKIYQHIDTEMAARALRNAAGGVETNRDSAIQIELVGFAHLRKNPRSLEKLARLCRWIEQTHKIPKVWPSGPPKAAKNGNDPGGHNRNVANWDTKSGHYGHSQVPENTHWDPAYLSDEVQFLMTATFDESGKLLSPSLLNSPAQVSLKLAVSTMPDHSSDGDKTIPDSSLKKTKQPRKDLKESGRDENKKKPRIYNARSDTLDFRDRMYIPSLIEVPTAIPLERYLDHGIPVLDQGSEGACTGFGLATVANFLLMTREYIKDSEQVSPRMLYDLARRYDEWPGEQYSGSSARGAMKGWNKHGVCAEREYPYNIAEGDPVPHLNDERISQAKRRPLGAYFRVNHQDIIAMHAAIAEVGVLYATSVVHSGWNNVGPDGIIPYTEESIGGHAFAIVAYDEKGFWIQNSWGDSWGRKGLAQINYDDWLENGTDVWVARLGAPVELNRWLSVATAHSTSSGQSSAYSFAALRPHLISVGNEGRLKPGGDYGSSEREVTEIFTADIPRFFARQDKHRILLYAHGGLTDAKSAVQRVSEYRPALLEAGIYPLAFIWNSDYWTTLTNMLQDAVRRRRPEGVLDKAKDFMLDRLDDALEPLARHLTGRASWREMKENALLASSPGGAANLIIKKIVELIKKYPDLEVHIVGHSAGSIFMAPLIQLLTTTGKVLSGPMKGEIGAGVDVATCTMWAPACTVQLFADTYLPAINELRIKKYAQYILNDKTEQDDDCASIYHKSLLYLVSNAFEENVHVPGFSNGTPILGLEKSLDEDERFKILFASENAELILAPNNKDEDSIYCSKAQHHGDFDDDVSTVKSTFKRICGDSVGTRDQQNGDIVFARSANNLRDRRLGIDEQTKIKQ